MKVIDPGHSYELDCLKEEGTVPFQFYKDPEIHGGIGHPGPSTQEAIRICIERVQTMNIEMPWKGNEKIIFHLRMALVGFEIRALERAVEKNEPVELWPVNAQGHLCGPKA
jgi:hypothetical protein